MYQKNESVALGDVCNQCRKRFLDTFPACVCGLEAEDSVEEEVDHFCRIWYGSFVRVSFVLRPTKSAALIKYGAIVPASRASCAWSTASTWL